MHRYELQNLVTEYSRRVWNEHDLSAIDEFSPNNTVLLNPAASDENLTRAELKERVGKVLRIMPDHVLEVGTIVAGNDEVIFQWRTTGHWTDEDRGTFPVDFGGITYWKVEDGRISVRDGMNDLATFGWQLRVYPRRLNMLIPV